MAVLAYHLVFSAYGHWLPNDPRGSGSTYVGSKDLLRFGRATHLDDRSRSVARRPHDQQLRQAAKQALKRPQVLFTGIQARAIGRGFANYVERHGLTVWACSILQAHVHMVVARFRLNAEPLVQQLKSAATRRLLKEELHPFQQDATIADAMPSCWAERLWKVYLDTEVAILREIRYVEENPEKDGKSRQKWSFVRPYPLRHPRSPV
ncbi:MAG TPA: hypothetical protein VL371_07040 [Gemmataceae bacterium]|jgi:REP element-mobilizing transposase RayT|nr:hypothetical protein [Gemmataceae bacterium]